MGIDTAEFGDDELRCVGGDYGKVVLEGTSEAARRALDAFVAATRRGSGSHRIVGLLVEYDDAPDLIPPRYAGREGPPARADEQQPGPVEDVEIAAAPGAADGTAESDS